MNDTDRNAAFGPATCGQLVTSCPGCGAFDDACLCSLEAELARPEHLPVRRNLAGDVITWGFVALSAVSLLGAVLLALASPNEATLGVVTTCSLGLTVTVWLASWK
jgi:hypothetical protein